MGIWTLGWRRPDWLHVTLAQTRCLVLNVRISQLPVLFYFLKLYLANTLLCKNKKREKWRSVICRVTAATRYEQKVGLSLVESCAVWFPFSRQNYKAASGLLNRNDLCSVSLESPSLTWTIYSQEMAAGKTSPFPTGCKVINVDLFWGKVEPRRPVEVEQSRAKCSLEFILQADTLTSDTAWKVALSTLRPFCRSH